MFNYQITRSKKKWAEIVIILTIMFGLVKFGKKINLIEYKIKNSPDLLREEEKDIKKFKSLLEKQKYDKKDIDLVVKYIKTISHNIMESPLTVASYFANISPDEFGDVLTEIDIRDMYLKTTKDYDNFLTVFSLINRDENLKKKIIELGAKSRFIIRPSLEKLRPFLQKQMKRINNAIRRETISIRLRKNFKRKEKEVKERMNKKPTFEKFENPASRKIPTPRNHRK